MCRYVHCQFDLEIWSSEESCPGSKTWLEAWIHVQVVVVVGELPKRRKCNFLELIRKKELIRGLGLEPKKDVDLLQE